MLGGTSDFYKRQEERHNQEMNRQKERLRGAGFTCEIYAQQCEEKYNKRIRRASIQKLERFIKPVTEKLDSYCNLTRDSSYREACIDGDTYEGEEIPLDYSYNQLFQNEKIFVSLLGIIKKQEARISQLEAQITHLSHNVKDPIKR
tara:strand:- start:161 stop:598 length:438 start_codon:yes stop_codon:yes gene_type:complete